MVDLLLKADQIKSAPREVKNWLKAMLERDLSLMPDSNTNPSWALAECTIEEAALVLAAIQNDYLACQVFFELGRDQYVEDTPPNRFHKVSLTIVMHHVRLSSGEHLIACLEEISQTFANVRHEPEVQILALDGNGNCYIRETTRQSIRAIWEDLVVNRTGKAAKTLDSRIITPSEPSMPTGQAGAPN